MIKTKTLNYIRARTRWPKVQDMVTWGLEQNDHRVTKVLSCNSSIIIAQGKNFMLFKGQNLKNTITIGLGNLWFTLCSIGILYMTYNKNITLHKG
jgi:hypothetical protein